MKTPQVTEAIAVPTISNRPTKMPYAKAVALATTLNKDSEDDWKYKVIVSVPSEPVIVAVYDEEDYLVGYL